MKDKLSLDIIRQYVDISGFWARYRMTYTPKYAMRRESLSINTLCMIEPGVERAIKKADILE